MIEFIKEALGDYAEVHDMVEQTSNGETGLRVLADFDGELRWFYITATECR